MDKPDNVPNCCQGIDDPCHNKPTWRKQNTAYEEERKNWVNMCGECFAHRQADWDAAWSDLYSGITG